MARNGGQSAERDQGLITCASCKFKMAVRFYNELNNLSTADFFDNTTTKKGKYYEVERVVSHRKHERKVS